MKKHLRRYAMGAMAVGAIASGTAFALQGAVAAVPDWQPVTYGLADTPAELLPANVSTEQPVRVVSTTLDSGGRPVVTVHTATDTAAATVLVRRAQQAPNAVGVEVDAPMHALDLGTGTDTYRGQQWDLTKIRVSDAWRQATGAGVTVAVIDTGVDASHPDLAGQVLPGFDEITQKAGVSIDPAGHGTHVAGTIAALTGNDVGVGSVAPNAKILPIRVLDANGSGYMSDAANGIVYAADHGANVINMSLGTTSKVAAVTNAIAYARSKGVVVVASSGNDRTKGSPVNYPAADVGVIAVAATDSNDAIATYSTAGGYVDLAAPGTAVLSTYPTAKGSGYTTMSGTSMASPHAAAVAALLKSLNPALSPDQVEQAMESSATDLGAKGRDNDFGYGRIDAAAALAAVKPATTTPSTEPTVPVTVVPTPTSTKTVGPTPTPTKTASPIPTKTTSPTPTPTKTTSPTTTPTKTTGPTPTPTKTASPTPTPTPSKTTAVKVRPTVTVGAVTQTVAYGTTATTAFTVTAAGRPWALRPVSICVTEAGGQPVCTAATTSAAGVVAVQRVATGAFQVQLTASATDVSEAVTSPAALTRVGVKLTVTRINGTANITLAGATGQNVQFQWLKGTTWTTVLTYRAAERGTVSGLIAGQSYRVVVPDTAYLLGATSNKF
jgi:type VII secretion-associated serine protease mycosin